MIDWFGKLLRPPVAGLAMTRRRLLPRWLPSRFDLAIDSKLRRCDVVKIKIGDIVSGGRVRARASSSSKKMGRPVQFELLEAARTTLLAWIDPYTIIGPFTSAKQVDRVLEFVDQARSDGADFVAGGLRIDREGFFLEPAVLADNPESMSVARAEILGPVVYVQSFGDDHLDAIASQANDTLPERPIFVERRLARAAKEKRGD